MIISIYSPHTSNNGNTISAVLLAMGLSDLKRKVLLTHTNPVSHSFARYMGLEEYEDKTSTPSQLVKLMREGAIKPEEIGDFSKSLNDYLDVFTNDKSNFSADDMHSLASFVLDNSSGHEYKVFDIDDDSKTADLVLSKSDIIILNINPDVVELDDFNRMRESIMKSCRGKKVILLANKFDGRSMKTKEIIKTLEVNTTCYTLNYNSWVRWACNKGKVKEVFNQGKTKDSTVIDMYKGAMSLVGAVTKTKLVIGKTQKGVFKGGK